MSMSGPNVSMTCDTAKGSQTFGTSSDTDPFRTLDGRLIAGRFRSSMTAEQYHAEIMENLITGREKNVKSAQFGDEAGTIIARMIGANVLSEYEARNVLSIIRAAFERPDRIPQAARDPSGTLRLLRNLAVSTDQASLKEQIGETIAYLQIK